MVVYQDHSILHREMEILIAVVNERLRLVHLAHEKYSIVKSFTLGVLVDVIFFF